MSNYLLHHLLEHARAKDSRFAIIDGEANYDIDALEVAAQKIALHLKQEGVQTGDRVAICLPKSFTECASMIGVSMAGGVFVPVNPVLNRTQMKHIVEDCGAVAILSDAANVPNFMGEDEPACAKSLALVEEILVKDLPDTENALSDEALGEDLAAILYTSGSTGRPKGVMLSHRNLIAGARIVSQYLEISSNDRILSLLPFSFDYGLNQFTSALYKGATIVLGQFKFGNDIVNLLEKHEVTGLAGVPAMWAILANATPKLKTTPLKNLRYITNSGGAVPEANVKKLRALLPDTDIYLMYGLTEAFRSSFLPPNEIDTRPTSMGKAIPECEIFALKSDGTRAKPGEQGILVHRGPTVSLGYWNRPEETAKVIRPNPLKTKDTGADLVCWSGDLVKEDEDGYFYFVARNDAMIKSAGFRISPTEVEEELMATGLFSQTAVIGIPDEWVGQKVHAVAVPKNEMSDASAALLEVKKNLPAYMVPKQIELVEQLPTTTNGKVDYKLLAAERAPC